MKSKTEKKLDDEFKEMGVKPQIYHFIENVKPFKAITILEYFSPSYTSARKKLDVARFHQYCRSPATELLDALHRQGVFGIAICDMRDQFNRQRGRIIAKGRLLKHLKGAKYQ